MGGCPTRRERRGSGVGTGSDARAVARAMLLTLVLTVGLPAALHAQDPDMFDALEEPPPNPIFIWGSYGIGTAFVSEGGDPQDAAQVARLTIERGANSLIFHYAQVGEAFGPASDEVAEIGALYGRALNRGWWKLQGAIGLARLSGFECIDIDHEEQDCDGTGTFGFPAFLEFTLRPLRFVGIGVQGFLTVSPDGQWGGVGIVGHLGWLR